MLKTIHSIQSVTDSDLTGQRVLVRVDFNVPLNEGQILDDTRILAVLPTIEYLTQRKAVVILVSHLGRPETPFDPAFSLRPIYDYLKKKLVLNIQLLDACVGDAVDSVIKQGKGGDVFLLENIRYYPQEAENDLSFSKQLASLADLFVQDSFGTVHRRHASTFGVASFLPAYSGLLVDKELSILTQLLSQPPRPFVAIVGGSKVSSKLGFLMTLMDQVDYLVIGGAMAYTFLYVQGYGIGRSLFESALCKDAENILKVARQKKVSIHLPLDHRVVTDFKAKETLTVTKDQAIPDSKIGVDVGPQTIDDIELLLKQAKTVFWNGPLGVFEEDAYAKSTFKVAQLVADSDARTVVGGGDSVAAIHQSGYSDQIDHISTGGGACLNFIEGKGLPGIEVLER